jgi:hypothetical protein
MSFTIRAAHMPLWMRPSEEGREAWFPFGDEFFQPRLHSRPDRPLAPTISASHRG